MIFALITAVSLIPVFLFSIFVCLLWIICKNSLCNPFYQGSITTPQSTGKCILTSILVIYFGILTIATSYAIYSLIVHLSSNQERHISTIELTIAIHILHGVAEYLLYWFLFLRTNILWKSTHVIGEQWSNSKILKRYIPVGMVILISQIIRIMIYDYADDLWKEQIIIAYYCADILNAIMLLFCYDMIFTEIKTKISIHLE